MAGFEKRSKRYPTDLTDGEWLFIQSFLPSVAKRGRKPAADVRDALRYLARTGGGWRMLPNDFPPWQTVYWWFRRFMLRLLFGTIYNVALMFGLILYRLDENLRCSLVLGFVGAGGLGFQLFTAISLFQYRTASLLLLMILIIVLMVEASSSYIRKKII